MPLIALLGVLVVIGSLGCSSNGSITDLLQKGVTAATPTPTPTPVSPVCDVSLVTSYGGGTGTASDPYTICSISQWNVFAADSLSWGKTFKLYADLDFNGLTFAQVKLIGTLATPFTGIFDGNNYKIKNINVSGGVTTFGLFLNTDGNATFKNLTLQNFNITAAGRIAGLILDHGSAGTLSLQGITATSIQLNFACSGSYCDNVGGLIGKVRAAVVADQISLNSITLAINDLTRYYGGFVGTIGTLSGGGPVGSTTITNLTANTITIPPVAGVSHDYGGGLIALAWGPINLTDVRMTGLDTDTSFTDCTGGVIAAAYGPLQFLRVRVNGTVKGSTSGGFVGKFDNYTSAPYTESLTM